MVDSSKKADKLQRTKRAYDGTQSTLKPLEGVLPHVLRKMEGLALSRNDQVLSDWPLIVGPQIAKMTSPVSCKEGVLRVKVANSSLYALLVTREKKRLLDVLRQRHPYASLNNIQFQLG